MKFPRKSPPAESARGSSASSGINKSKCQSCIGKQGGGIWEITNVPAKSAVSAASFAASSSSFAASPAFRCIMFIWELLPPYLNPCPAYPSRSFFFSSRRDRRFSKLFCCSTLFAAHAL